MKTVILKRKTTKQPNLPYVQHSVTPTPCQATSSGVLINKDADSASR